jgi:hypothetical protein
MGRRGSFRPERARRMASAGTDGLDLADDARLPRSSSMRNSFCASSSSKLVTGMPVQGDHLGDMSRR